MDEEVTAPTADALAPGETAPQIVNPDSKKDVAPARKALVGKWIGRVKSAKGFFRKEFEQMAHDIEFAKGKQWKGGNNDRYVANIVQRHIAQKVASLYAKNPKIICRRRDTLDFALWNESMATVEAGMVQAQQAQAMGQPLSPNLTALIQDITTGMNKRFLMDKIAKTAEILANHFLDSQNVPFKSQMKQLVKRGCTTAVGYVKLGIRRSMEMRPEDADNITDITAKLQRIQTEIYDLTDGDEKDAMSAEAEQLRLQLADLHQSPYVTKEEGPTFDFPRSNAIIPDPRCTQLSQFVGVQWVAQEYILSPADVKDIYHVDLKKGKYTEYDNPSEGEVRLDSSERERNENGQFVKSSARARVWEIYSKVDKMVYVVCDGHDDFLKEPGEPDVKIKRFWPFFCLAFNEAEDDKCVYPQSDVLLMRDQQREYNRQRDGLREHRFANRPATAVADGMLDETDIAKLQTHPANAVLTLKALQPGQKIEEVLQTIKNPAIDPALYDVAQVRQDMELVVGSQEANLGTTSGATATESSIAESSRMTSQASNIDDLDDLLSDLARALGEVMFMEIQPETAKKIAGPGAVWPQLSAQEISDELYLEIQAGSSGRPNKAAEMENFTKLAPILLQIPGIDPVWLARQAIMRLDDKLNATDALTAGLQSILAQNAQKQVMPANPAHTPSLQGGQGNNNAPAAPVAPPQGGGSPLLPRPQH